MSGHFRADSIVEYFSLNCGSCGYCKSGEKSSKSVGLWAHYLAPSHYQDMIDRGWRRSGRYCYKPLMKQTCCPQYAIRCSPMDFKPSKSQKKVVKKFLKFLRDDVGGEKRVKVLLPPPPFSARDEDLVSDEDVDVDDELDDAVEERAVLVQEKLQASKKHFPSENSAAMTENEDKSIGGRPGMGGNGGSASGEGAASKPQIGPDPNKPRARKAKDIRREKAALKGKVRAKGPTDPKQGPASEAVDKLLRKSTYDAQMGSEPKHRFEIRLVKAQETDGAFRETMMESFEVYRKYQVTVHKDKPEKCTRTQWLRFLCNSSLIYIKKEAEGKGHDGVEGDDDLAALPPAYGAYHQQYLIDGKIAFVGVVDVLPYCVSSVYLYYDPEFSFLSPGTLSALFEIAFVRRLNGWWDSMLRYYYMGYYIHSCPKMKYKGQYLPSRLLCPESYRWMDVERCSHRLDRSKYARLDDDDASGETRLGHVGENRGDWQNVSVLYNRMAMTYKDYLGLKSMAEEEGTSEADLLEMKEYVLNIGTKLARTILLFRS